MTRSKSESDEPLRPLDDKAIKLLVERHREFKAFLAKRVHDEATAEDLLQQSLKKAFEHPARSNEDSSVLAWFYSVLRNTLTDYYRSRASDDRKYQGYLNELSARDQTQQAPMDAVEAAICKCMTGLLPTLQPAYGELVRRIDLSGESMERVAGDLSITPNNLKVRLHRARQALKKSLERACGTCTEHGCLDCTCQ